MFAAFPLLALPVVIYNLLALTFTQGFKAADASSRLTQPLFSISMTSRVEWPISSGDLVLAVALIVLFIELLKSTTSHKVVIVNHALSMLLFVACLVEFLLAPAFATSTFFLLTLMVVLDVLAGFIVTISTARREIDFNNDRG
ncbi:MAG: hypothetical protein CFE28_16375 [Alphaproteobacteria bacterium PA2]|jgi:hypothetical protein|nr:MAG: hypothetical protein CFE28_16375 [Alphaproteobacteria bacterium PA2]